MCEIVGLLKIITNLAVVTNITFIRNGLLEMEDLGCPDTGGF